MKRLLSIMLLLMIAAVAEGYADESEDIRKVAEANIVKWNSAFNRGDASALKALYAQDAILLTSSGSARLGAQDIRGFWEALINIGWGNHSVEIVEIYGDGDLIYVAATWSAFRTPRDGRSYYYEGNLVNVLERQKDGTWKTRLQNWN